MRALRTRVAAFGRAFANPDIRRIQLAHGGSLIGTWSYAIALFVYAYDVGGARAVGLVAAVRWIPAAVASPFAGLLGDRYPRARVMLVADVVRVGAMLGSAATIALGGPAALVYALAALTSVTATAFGPAKRALLPSLARTPDELTAANVASSTMDSVAVLVGPALGGLVLAATSVEVVFLFNAVALAWSAALVLRLRGGRERPAGASRAGGARAIAAELGEGLSLAVRRPAIGLIILLNGAQTLLFGALMVFVVVLALELLDLGDAGVGFLNSALGIGGLLGSVAAVALIGRARLAPPLVLGLAFWGLPLAFLGVWPHAWAALLLFPVIGVANTLFDVASLTLLQRLADESVLGRVFGVLEGLSFLGIAIGGLGAPVLIDALGARAALVVAGLLLPAVALLSWRGLAQAEKGATAPGRALDLLRALPMFAPLPAQTIERLAAELRPVPLAAGQTLFRQGDPGDRFYVVAAGEVEVRADGRPTARLGPGECLGEIALLRDVPRTATVAATSDAELYALERDEFVRAVTGHPESARAADAVVAERLSPLRAAGT
ncbi:MAG TPA: MFS transporter [Gaiellaceae bacterium]|nr:MFS transporter [Gaiellaceae bacterium]